MGTENKSYLEMSDEEIMNAPPPEFSDESEAENQNENGEGKEPVEDDNTQAPEGGLPTEEEPEVLEDEDGGEVSKEEDGEEEEGSGEPNSSPESKEEPESTPKDQKPKDKEAPADQADKEGEIDYKAVYEQIFTPFKANGKEFKVKSPEDAISLMQMGANYNKKMAALKPNLRLMKMLEKNQLLDEEKLGFLIDLDKRNPEAINKLVKDSGIDPLDLDAEKASEYKPNTYTVDDREVELDTVLESLADSPTYTRTLDVVGNKWDGASKQIVADQPQLLKVINDHMESGIYDVIAAEIESERMFGRLQGLSDLEAYRQVGDAIDARGGFAHLVKNQGQQTPPPGTVVNPPPKKADDDKLKEKKRAASSPKQGAPKQANKDFNPLSMSDEEFSKLVNENFL